MLPYIYWCTELYLDKWSSKSVIFYPCKTLEQKKKIPTLYNGFQKWVDDNPPLNIINRNLVIYH